MPNLGELFKGQPAAPPIPTVDQPPVSTAGAPPGDQRYGPELPLTDRYAGRTLADLLKDFAGQVNADDVMKQLRPADGSSVLQTRVATDTVYLQRRGTENNAGLSADNLVVLPRSEAMAMIQGQRPQTLLGGTGGTQRRPAMPGVKTGGPPIGPPGLGGYRT